MHGCYCKKLQIEGLSPTAVCQVCVMGEDETVEHVVLDCVKYARDRNEMMQVVLSELGHDSGDDRKDRVAAGTLWGDRRRMRGRLGL